MSLLIEALKRAEQQRKQQRAEAAALREAAQGNLPEPVQNPPPASTPATPDFPAITLDATPLELAPLSAATPPDGLPGLRIEPTLAPPAAQTPPPLTLADFEAPSEIPAPPEPPLTALPPTSSPEPALESALKPPPPAPSPESLPPAGNPTPLPPETAPKPPAAASPPPEARTGKIGASASSEQQIRAQALKTMLTGQNTATAPGRKRLLLIALFGLSALAGMGAYLWWLSASTAPGSLLIASTPPGEPASEPPLTPPPAPPLAPPPVAPAETPPPATPGASAEISVAPPGKKTEAKTENKATPALASPSAPENPPTYLNAKRPAESRPISPPTSRSPVIRRNDPADDAWQALRAGRTAEASEKYQKALRNDPRNREVLLGLAEAAVREGQAMQAIDYYERVLRLNPRDPDANAGMALLQGNSDPLTYEARLQALLGEQASNAGLHFALGTLLAGQKRWHEAQQAFFQAATLAPDNADYQFNLAVSLDQMGKYRNARDFYEKALLLSQKRPGNFLRDAVQSRLEVLTDFIR